MKGVKYVYKHREVPPRTWIHVLELGAGAVPAISLLDDALEHGEAHYTTHTGRRDHPSRRSDAADLTDCDPSRPDPELRTRSAVVGPLRRGARLLPKHHLRFYFQLTEHLHGRNNDTTYYSPSIPLMASHRELKGVYYSPSTTRTFTTFIK